MAQEGAAHGITFNVIAPGYIATEMVQAVPKEMLETKILPLIPVGRLGTAEEVARCVAFLAADEAGFITGACLDANGGQYMAVRRERRGMPMSTLSSLSRPAVELALHPDRCMLGFARHTLAPSALCKVALPGLY